METKIANKCSVHIFTGKDEESNEEKKDLYLYDEIVFFEDEETAMTMIFTTDFNESWTEDKPTKNDMFINLTEIQLIRLYNAIASHFQTKKYSQDLSIRENMGDVLVDLDFIKNNLKNH